MVTIVKPKILEKLINLQAQMSNAEFAKKLNVSESLWKLTKLGYKKVHYDLLSATIRAYPELIPDVIEYMRDDHEQSPKSRS